MNNGNGSLDTNIQNHDRHAEAQSVKWLSWLLDNRGRSPHTVGLYGVILRQWIDWASTHGVRLEAPAAEELDAFVLRKLERGKGTRAPSSRNTDVVVLRGFYRWLHERGHIPSNPTADLQGPSVPKRKPKPVRDDHWLTFWTSDLTDTLRTASGLAYFCGLRRAEISSLQGHMFKDGRVTFIRKGGNEVELPWRKMVDAYADTIPELLGWLSASEFAYMLNQRAARHKYTRMFWDGRRMYEAMQRQQDRLNIPQFSPHQLRHSCASNLVNRAHVPMHIVADLLNHGSIDITRGYVASGETELDRWRQGLEGRKEY